MNNNSKKTNLNTDVIHDVLNIHPSETIFEILHNKRMSKKEFIGKIDFTKTHFTKQYVLNVLNEKEKITNDFAVELERIFEIPSSFWLNLQHNYDRENEASTLQRSQIIDMNNRRIEQIEIALENLYRELSILQERRADKRDIKDIEDSIKHLLTEYNLLLQTTAKK